MITKLPCFVRKRSQSAGSGKFEKKSSKDDIYRREDEGEGEDGDSSRKSSSGSEARLAQYEKPLTKGHKTSLREKREKDPEKIARRKTEKRERSQVRWSRLKTIQGTTTGFKKDPGCDDKTFRTILGTTARL